MSHYCQFLNGLSSIFAASCPSSVFAPILSLLPICKIISWNGFSFCSLIFLDIKKPQPLDFSKDCDAYFYYLALQKLLDDSSNTTRTNCTTTLTVFCEGNRCDFTWFIGLFQWFFLWYAPCIWRFSNFCYHGVITKAFQSLLLYAFIIFNFPISDTIDILG